VLFGSQQFFVFFTLVFALYWAMPWPRLRVALLLAASYYFYASWNQWLALLIAVTSVLDYLVALGMDASSRQIIRRLLLLFSLAVNLALLCYFKYANFFLDSLETALVAAGAQVSLPVLKVILPIGISFYTFEAINYTVDVYRRKAPAERNLFHFMLFILFFPHLIAGPIVRARDFLPQIRRPKRWSWLRLQLGVQFFLMGIFKKLAIADRMALYVDPVFQAPEQFSTHAIWIAAFAYAVQIFCDFSGYTDMAIGTAHMLGYKLAQNFNLPYLATSVADFWRRWHMSLSSWLRDYLYFPLGGSRGSRWQTYRNLLITMVLCGLWHGASWIFVLFGVVHGVYLIVHRRFREFCAARPRLEAALGSAPGTAVRWLLTLLCVVLSMALFRCPDWQTATALLPRLVVPSPGRGSAMDEISLWLILALVVLAHGIGYFQLWKKASVRLPAPALGLGYAVSLSLAMLLAPEVGKAFIYFQF
jgi:alginate O-acetyltransferase complex protein AlgI